MQPEGPREISTPSPEITHVEAGQNQQAEIESLSATFSVASNNLNMEMGSIISANPDIDFSQEQAEMTVLSTQLSRLTKDVISEQPDNNPTKAEGNSGNEGLLPKSLDVYIDKRFEDESAFSGSNVAREIPDEKREGYVAELKKTSSEIISEFGLGESLFEEPAIQEAFLVAADSWLANEKGGVDAPTYIGEKKFLTQYIRLLSGNKSKFNMGAREKGEENSDYYVDFSTEEDEAKSKRIREHVDPVRTERMRAVFEDFSDDSFLAEVRSRLNVTPDSQKPFDILVLDASTDQFKEGREGVSEFAEIAGIVAPAFVEIDFEGGTQTIVLSADAVDELESESGYGSGIGDIKHEYAHTQRQLRIGAQTSLGRLLDEAMVSWSSGGGGYYDARTIFRTMDYLTQNEDKSFLETLNNTWKTDKGNAELYKYISNNFGMRSLVTLLASRPRNYTEGYGFDAIPGVSSDPKQRPTDLFNFILKEREKIAQGSNNRFREQIAKLSNKDGTGFLLISQNGGIDIPQDIFEELKPKYAAEMGVEPRRIIR